MLKSDSIQIGNNQMVSQSGLSAHYLDISCIYMLLTSAGATFLTLVFYVFTKHFFRNIPYATGKIPLCSESMFLPEMLFEIVWISLPNRICRIAFHQIYDFTDRHGSFRFYHVRDMVFIRLPISDNDFVFLTYLVRKLLSIV